MSEFPALVLTDPQGKPDQILSILSSAGRLFLVLYSEEGAGLPQTDPRDLLEKLGCGSENHHQRGLRQRLRAAI